MARVALSRLVIWGAGMELSTGSQDSSAVLHLRWSRREAFFGFVAVVAGEATGRSPSEAMIQAGKCDARDKQMISESNKPDAVIYVRADNFCPRLKNSVAPAVCAPRIWRSPVWM